MANSATGDSSTDRLIRVLETFTATRAVQTAAEISRRADLPASSGHRIVVGLADAGLLERDLDGRYRIGMRLWELATRSSLALRLRQVALPHMSFVHSAVQQHTQLAILEHDEALFLERLSAEGSGSNVTRIAGRLPLHASSSGLVLLAHADPALQERVLAGPLPALTRETTTDPGTIRRRLAEIRARGVCIAPGSIELVSTGVAVPVRDRRERVVAALSVVLPRAADPAEAVERLRIAAARIAASLDELD